jgi:CDGSH-type Zn-finger protein
LGKYEMSAATIARLKPYLVQVEKGKSYFWCACGLSKKQPFCDGSHKVTEFLPLKWVAEQTGEKLLCACKHTRAQPFCDGSHNSLSDTYAEADEADGAGAELVDYVPGEGGALKAMLDNGCYVIRVPESALSVVGTMKIYPVIGEIDGAKNLSQYQAVVATGQTPVLSYPGSDVVLFIVSGQGTANIGDRAFPISAIARFLSRPRPVSALNRERVFRLPTKMQNPSQ